MKRIAVTLYFTTIFIAAISCDMHTGQGPSSPTPAPAATPVVTENVDAAIRQLVKDRDTALRTADTAAMERIYSDTYVSTSPTGLVRSKAEVIADFKAGTLKIESIDSEDLTVHPYGDSVVVTGLTRIKGTDKGRSLTGDQRFTQVYAKKGGRWQIVAFHLSSIPK